MGNEKVNAGWGGSTKPGKWYYMAEAPIPADSSARWMAGSIGRQAVLLVAVKFAVLGLKMDVKYALSFDGHVMGLLMYSQSNVLVQIRTELEPNHPSPLKVCDHQAEIRSRDCQIMRTHYKPKKCFYLPFLRSNKDAVRLCCPTENMQKNE